MELITPALGILWRHFLVPYNFFCAVKTVNAEIIIPRNHYGLAGPDFIILLCMQI